MFVSNGDRAGTNEVKKTRCWVAAIRHHQYRNWLCDFFILVRMNMSDSFDNLINYFVMYIDKHYIS